jgi:hypothetical protein
MTAADQVGQVIAQHQQDRPGITIPDPDQVPQDLIVDRAVGSVDG